MHKKYLVFIAILVPAFMASVTVNAQPKVVDVREQETVETSGGNTVTSYTSGSGSVADDVVRDETDEENQGGALNPASGKTVIIDPYRPNTSYTKDSGSVADDVARDTDIRNNLDK